MKKKMHYNFYIVISCALLFLFPFCTRDSQGIDLNLISIPSVSALFSQVWVVPLETNSRSLISEPSKIIYHDSHYYVLDRKSQRLFCFDENGSFCFEIAAKGNGPGEYHYIQDFSIDISNDNIILLDPVFQYVHFYDLTGEFIRRLYVNTEKTIGFNEVYSLNDSTLLLSSITFEQIWLVNSFTGKVRRSAWSYPGNVIDLGSYTPDGHIYQLGGETFVMPAFSQHVYNINDIQFTSHHNWCFGENNNAEKQIGDLIGKYGVGGIDVLPDEEVGRGKLLNHFFYKIAETKRYHLAILEYDLNFLHIVLEKETNDLHVFQAFADGVSLFGSFIQSDRVIGVEKHLAKISQNYPGYSHRVFDYLQMDLLTEIDKEIVRNHNPMTDNPFLVVYKFK